MPVVLTPAWSHLFFPHSLTVGAVCLKFLHTEAQKSVRDGGLFLGLYVRVESNHNRGCINIALFCLFPLRAVSNIVFGYQVAPCPPTRYLREQACPVAVSEWYRPARGHSQGPLTAVKLPFERLEII